MHDSGGRCPSDHVRETRYSLPAVGRSSARRSTTGILARMCEVKSPAKIEQPIRALRLVSEKPASRGYLATK